MEDESIIDELLAVRKELATERAKVCELNEAVLAVRIENVRLERLLAQARDDNAWLRQLMAGSDRER